MFFIIAYEIPEHRLDCFLWVSLWDVLERGWCYVIQGFLSSLSLLEVLNPFLYWQITYIELLFEFLLRFWVYVKIVGRLNSIYRHVKYFLPGRFIWTLCAVILPLGTLAAMPILGTLSADNLTLNFLKFIRTIRVWCYWGWDLYRGFF